MYYFVPKRAERPIYSYRLSIIHFWALIFMYIWAGPHHLHYTALPDWAQTLGMTSRSCLDAVLGGMINGLMTLSGAWTSCARPGAALHGGVAGVLRYGDLRGPLMPSRPSTGCSTTPTGPSATSIRARSLVAYISFGAIYCLGAVAMEPS